MMTKEDSELLSAYLDKELRGDKLALVRDRLAASSEWRAESELLKRSKNLMATLPVMPAPKDLLNRLGRAAEERYNRKTSLWESIRETFEWNPWLTSGSAVAAAALIAIVYVHRGPQTQTMPLEPLMAAHAQGQNDTLLPQRVLNASEYSSEFRSNAAS